ncbi:DUF4240 domain-containing protein [Streptomyces sp. V4-01]|uniref:DUF4240 domain-containing protein n=1 Tax=Actinacidiphila polyblastidii TaxID=3110430 RepID=A0ABU7PL08_9ACTN|nr:DUF4240 domain-containing protein [Streptomyces sp. V4-01]
METGPLWTLMADVRRLGLTGGRRDAWLREALLELGPGGLARFQAGLDDALAEAFTWNLWAAADRLFGGWCSDDAFAYFQRWMVGLGRPVFEAVVADPDALAHVPQVRALAGRPRHAWGGDAPQWPSLPDLAPAAHARLTGAPEDAFHAAVAALRTPAAPAAAPSGRRWSAVDESEAVRRLPRLAALFPLPEGGAQVPLTSRM